MANNTLKIFVTCSPQRVDGIFCRLQVNDMSDEVTVKVAHSHWVWGDGTEEDAYLTGDHTFPNAGTFNFMVEVFLIDGRSQKYTSFVSVR